MAGGNRAYTLQDVLGQLNQDSQQGQADNGATLQINQLTIADNSVAVAEAVTLATAATSFSWNDSNAVWGALPWATSGMTVDGGSASSSLVSSWDGGSATSPYVDFSSLNGGNANG